MPQEPIAHSALYKYATEYANRMALDICKYAGGGVHSEGAELSSARPAPSRNLAAGTQAQATDRAVSANIKQETAGAPKFKLGNDSRTKLSGVIPTLCRVVDGAIELTEHDFCVYEGLRTAARQSTLVKQGYSKTMESKHLRQSDGYGHAVDLVPWIQGHPKWDWGGCYAIAVAMTEAATRLGVANKIRWGAVWDRTLADLAGDNVAMTRAVVDYANRHPGKDFLDGPHFEWIGN